MFHFNKNLYFYKFIITNYKAKKIEYKFYFSRKSFFQIIGKDL